MNPAPIVVTRLAIRKRGAPDPPAEDWIRARVELLRQVGWPALQRAGSGVAWVLIVDAEVRGLVAGLLGDLELTDGSIHLAEGEGFAPRTADLRLRDEVHPGRDAFVTIRLDSDDALLPGSIDAVVTATAGSVDGTVIDLPHGYQLDLDRRDLVEVAYPRWRQGPFLAIVHHDRSTMLDTGGEHPQARAGRAIRHVDTPTWLQGIHGANVSNERAAASIGTRLVRAVRAVRRGGATSAWRNGRGVPSRDAAAILAAAGITELS